MGSQSRRSKLRQAERQLAKASKRATKARLQHETLKASLPDTPANRAELARQELKLQQLELLLRKS